MVLAEIDDVVLVPSGLGRSAVYCCGDCGLRGTKEIENQLAYSEFVSCKTVFCGKLRVRQQLVKKAGAAIGVGVVAPLPANMSIPPCITFVAAFD